MLSIQPLKPAPRKETGRNNDTSDDLIAEMLQAEEDSKTAPFSRQHTDASDDLIAVLLQAAEMDHDPKVEGDQTRNIDESDDLIAALLQAAEMDQDPKVESDETRKAREEDERLACKLRLKEEEELQVASVPGRAIRFVQALLVFVSQKQKEYKLQRDEFSALSKDSMVPMAEAFLTLQDSFRSQGKSTHVDLGFHYTAESNLNSIRDEGLLTKADRSARGVHTNNYNGENYGTGVYTADDPASSCNFGSVGLIVARLRGHVTTYTLSSMPATAVYDHDTMEVPQVAYTVLRQSAQCVPLVQFQRDYFRFTQAAANGYKHTSSNASMDIEVMTDIMKALQKELVDRKLIIAQLSVSSKNSRPTAVGASQASKFNATSVSQQFGASPLPSFSATTHTAAAGFSETVEYKAPNTFSSLPEINTKFLSKKATVNHGECRICLEDMKIGELVTSLSPACDHRYHSACLQRHYTYQQRCPTCRIYLNQPQGTSPSGTMKITIDHKGCCGGYQCGTIVIQYEIPSGIQKQYHENPGTYHGGTSRTAYLPDTDDGRETLKRLKYAFRHGLVFTVGTSMTTQVKNSVTWASIHHKTKLVGGTHGFPDDSYFINVNEELDTAGVPPADSLS